MNARAELPFDTCIQEALSQSRGWMAQWVRELAATLTQREASELAPHTKRAAGQARAALAACADRLADRWSDAFAQAVRADIARNGNALSQASAPKALSLDELELMDHRQVQASVELARLQQIVKSAVDEEQIALTALLCAARGLSKVRSEANPLRPEVVVDALTTALDGLNVDDASRQRWLQAGAQSLGQILLRTYALLVQRLQSQGIEPAGFVVVPVVSARPSPGGVATRGETAVAIGGPHGEQPLVLTLDQLHHLLVGNLAQGGTAVSDHGSSGSGNAMVRTLAAEVVTLMLRGIAEDQRLLAPIREMVQQLKPALLHLAKTDPRFFADRHNPARRLLDVIIARSLAFASEQDEGFAAFALQVHLSVQSLQTLSNSLSERIAERVHQLESLDTADQAPAMQTLVRAEQRHLLAERIACEIRERADFARAPTLVKRFLLGPWAHAVAHARLHADELGHTPMLADQSLPPEAPAQRYMDILGDLLWSCQLAQASQNRARLIRVIPQVLRTLREGLDAIDFPRGQAESFFQALMGLHEAAYKTQRSDDFLAAVQRGIVDGPLEPWLADGEARDSGFIDTQPMEPAFLDTQPMEREPELGEALSVGAWVELQQEGRMQRCQLRWLSPHRTMFLFATAEGQPVSLTRRGLDRLIASGRLRVVAEHGVVDEALAQVARLAWVNSGRLA